MRKAIFVVIISLLSVSLVYAGITVSGGIKYTSADYTLTESTEAPSNPSTNDRWRDTTTNTVYEWDGEAWKNISSTSNLTKQKSEFKAALASVTDANAKEALEILGKIVFEKCGEEL